MNALRPTIQRSVVRRFASGSAGPVPKHIPSQYHYNFKSSWLSDPSTYPIMFIMGGALTFMVGAGVHALVYYKDVQVSPAKRNQMLQPWGEERKEPTVSKGVSQSFYRKFSHEGQGIDHEEWVKQKNSR